MLSNKWDISSLGFFFSIFVAFLPSSNTYGHTTHKHARSDLENYGHSAFFFYSSEDAKFQTILTNIPIWPFPKISNWASKHNFKDDI